VEMVREPATSCVTMTGGISSPSVGSGNAYGSGPSLRRTAGHGASLVGAGGVVVVVGTGLWVVDVVDMVEMLLC